MALRSLGRRLGPTEDEVRQMLRSRIQSLHESGELYSDAPITVNVIRFKYPQVWPVGGLRSMCLFSTFGHAKTSHDRLIDPDHPSHEVDRRLFAAVERRLYERHGRIA